MSKVINLNSGHEQTLSLAILDDNKCKLSLILLTEITGGF